MTTGKLDPPITPAEASIVDIVHVNGRTRPHDPAFADPDAAVTWRQFSHSVRAAATRLEATVRPKDVVAMLAPSSVATWATIFGVLDAGGVVAPLNLMLKPDALGAALRDCGARLLLAATDYLPLAQQLSDTAEHTVTVDEITGTMPEAGASGGPARGRTRCTPDAACTVIYTSGTTGTPKGIVHSHRARAAMASTFAHAFGMSPRTRTLLTTPPHSNGAWMTVLPTLYVGGSICIHPKFDAEQVLRAIDDGTTFTFVVPTMAQRLLASPSAARVDWSRLEMILTAGAPMPPQVKQEMRALCGERLGELWGFTEGVATILQPADMAAHPESVGRPMTGAEFRVIDTADTEVSAGTVGELVGRSDWMSRGYLGRPDAAAALIWTCPDGLPFLRTGDLGSIDEHGWISVRGRKKDMIISGGYNIYPADLETILAGHPLVADCAVVGAPDLEWGERPAGFVTLTDPAADPAPILAWFNDHDRVARHQRLAQLVALDTPLPRNSLEKIEKFKLLDLLDAIPPGRVVDAKEARP